MKFKNVFLGIGTNVGELEKNIFLSLCYLMEHPSIELKQISKTYITQPLYYPDQDNFLNLVVQISTDLTPTQLLKVVLEIEKKMGRHRNGPPKGPRIIDIDILFFDDQVIKFPGLIIPHPHLYERKFVLVPMSEIAPYFTCPVKKKSVKELLAQCQDESWIKAYTGKIFDEKSLLHSH